VIYCSEVEAFDEGAASSCNDLQVVADAFNEDWMLFHGCLH